MEGDVGVGIALVEELADALHDHGARIVVDGGQQQGHDGGREVGDDVALAQVDPEDLDEPGHDVVLADVVHLAVVRVADHDDAQEHGGAQPLQVAHLQVVDLLEHVVVAHERAALVGGLAKLVADGVQVELQGAAGAVQLGIELPHVLAGLRAQVAVSDVGGVAVLGHGVADTVELDHGLHQLDVEAVVKVVHLQRRATDRADVVVGLGLAEQLYVIVHRVQILPVQALGVGRLLLQRAGLVEVALVQLQQLAVQLPLGIGVSRLVDLLEQVDELQQIHAHVLAALPVVRAPVRNYARAQARGHLVEHAARAADEGLERVLRVGHHVFGPQLPQQPLVRHLAAPVQDQKRDQSRSLSGARHRVLDALLVDEDQIAPHHLYSYAVLH